MSSLKNKQVVITAGPTREPIDPVRYLSNRSSGKMGYAIAAAARNAGANVTLISGPASLSSPQDITFIKVNTANEMLEAVMSVISDCDIFIAAAAVVDYRPLHIEPKKIKKSGDEMTLTLVRNPDILDAVSHLSRRPICIGFAAETDNLIKHAKEKLKKKNLDMIVANPVGQNQGFDSDDNEAIIIMADGSRHTLEKQPKEKLAAAIISYAKHLAT